MTTDPKLRKRGKLKVASLIALAVVVGLWAVVKMNPLIFNESFLGHAHCIKIADAALNIYVQEHGAFPYHTNGFGDAVLLFNRSDWMFFTGPGFDESELKAAFAAGRDVDETKLGRIYVQGLSTNANPRIAILFDQIATPGGDHAHFQHRFTAPYLREVLEIGDGMRRVDAVDWYAYATNQIELLVAEGIDRGTARHYYEMTGLKFDE